MMIDQATVGRRIYALEEKLGTRLFEKRSDGFYLTIYGDRIRSAVEDVERSFSAIDRRIAGKDERMEGRIRIAMPGALANHLVIPHLYEFTNKYSQVELNFLTGPEVLNLAKREADMAFRFVRPSQKDLVVKKVCDITLALCASKKLLKKYPKIQTAEDLRAFPFVGLYETAQSQTEKILLAKLQHVLQPPVMKTMAWSSIYSAVSNQVGIGILPLFMIPRNSDVEEISIAVSERTPLWFVIHPEVRKNRRFTLAAAFLSQVKKEFGSLESVPK